MGLLGLGMTALNVQQGVDASKKYIEQAKKARAGQYNQITKQAGPSMSGFGTALAYGTGMAAAGALAAGGARGVGKIYDHFKAKRIFEDLKRKYPRIKNDKRAREYYDMILSYAPALMRHERAIGDFLDRQLEYPASSIEFITQLAALEEKIIKGRSPMADAFGRDVVQSGMGFVREGPMGNKWGDNAVNNRRGGKRGGRGRG